MILEEQLKADPLLSSHYITWFKHYQRGEYWRAVTRLQAEYENVNYPYYATCTRCRRIGHTRFMCEAKDAPVYSRDGSPHRADPAYGKIAAPPATHEVIDYVAPKRMPRPTDKLPPPHYFRKGKIL